MPGCSFIINEMIIRLHDVQGFGQISNSAGQSQPEKLTVYKH